MTAYKSGAGILMMMAALGVTGCDRGDRGHDRDHADEHRDQQRDARPCDRDHDSHCDDRRR
jgi:hypothetical protein